MPPNYYSRFIEIEQRSRRKLSAKRAVDNGVYVTFSRSSWTCMWPDDPTVLRSHLFAWILVGEKRVGAVKINSYKANENCDNDDFCLILDGHSGEEYALAALIGRSWDDVYSDLCLWGPILYLTDVWTDERFAAPDILAKALRTLTRGPLRRHSIFLANHLVLGFPKALIVKAVNAREFPGRAGDRGWLWAPSFDDIDTVRQPDERRRVSRTGYF